MNYARRLNFPRDFRLQVSKSIMPKNINITKNISVIIYAIQTRFSHRSAHFELGFSEKNIQSTEYHIR